MVYDSITQHPTLAKLIKFLDGSNGREKLLRTLQYLARFLSYYFLRSGYSITTYQLTKRIQSLLTLSRKPLRALKPLNHLKSLSVTIDDELSDKYLKLFESLKQINYALYFSFDSVQWLKLLGLLGSGTGLSKSNKLIKKIDSICYSFWFLALLSGVLNNLRQINISIVKKNQLIKNLNNNENNDPLDEKSNLNVQNDAIKAENLILQKTKRDLIKNLLDAVIALSGLKMIKVDEGLVGAAGVITSVLGLQDIWRSTKL